MRTEQFRGWLNDKGLKPKPVSDALSRCRRIASAYGDLEAAWERDQFSSIIEDLHYSSEDEANARPNPSRILIKGNLRNGLASLKSAIANYRGFMDDSAA